MTRWWLPTLVILTLGAAVLAVPSSNLDRALETQQQLAADRPTDPAVFNDLGNLLVMAHRLDEAELAYRTAIQLDPGNTNSLFNLAMLLGDQGERKEAMSTLEKIVELDPRHAWAHFHLGRLLEASGSPQKAVEAYALAFALEPELTFPEVNPQLLDSKLMTQALIAAYDGDLTPVDAPRLYSDPQHVRELLLPVWARQNQEDAADQNQGKAPSGTRGNNRDGSQSPGDDEANGQIQDMGKSSETPTQVGKSLGPDDLEEGSSVGQASPLQIDPTHGNYSDRVTRRLRRATEQRTTSTSGSSSGSNADRYNDNRGGVVRGPRTSTFSTGRIDLPIRPLAEPMSLARLDKPTRQGSSAAGLGIDLQARNQ
jgi:hypothetical protein